MKPEPITELEGIYRGHDVYVIGSGPSAGYIEPEFFNNKYCLGVNNVWMRFPVDYVVRKEFNMSQHTNVPRNVPLIMAKHHCGVLAYDQNKFDRGMWYTFEHENNDVHDVDLDVIGTDKIVVSFSTITSAMHLAAYMGAENIILVGHDCGWLDGESNIPGYPPPISSDKDYVIFLKNIEPQTIAVRERIKEVYGCRTYSLNPFINFGLEGHEYTRG